jgi:DNA-directed RNA polymerase omega subunit
MTGPRLDLTTDRAVKVAAGKFTLVGAIVARAAQLGMGWPPLVTGVAIDKYATTALREIAAGAVEVNPPVRPVRERDEREAA